MLPKSPRLSPERSFGLRPSPDSLQDPFPDSFNGSADLTFAARHGRTRLVKSRVHPPLAVQRALYLDNLLPDMAFLCLANPTAGIFQGDRQRILVSVQQGAKTNVTNQSANKIHAMPESSAYQYTDLSVMDDGYLEYLPEPLIPFRGSRLRQETCITVSDTATLLYAEITAPGRVARGEVFEFDWLDTRLTVTRPNNGPLDSEPGRGEPIYHEAYRLKPVENCLRKAAVLGKCYAPTLGSLLIITATIPAPDLAAELRRVINPAVDGVQGMRPELMIGATCLPGDCGVGIRVIGAEVQQVKSVLTMLASSARLQLIGAPLPPSRKY